MSKISKINKTSKNLGIDTSGMTKAERDVSNSIDKIKQSLAGLNSYKNAALGGDSSSLTSFNRRVISIQSAIDTLGEKLQQLGNNRIGVNIDTDRFQSFRTELADIQATLNNTKLEVDTSGTSSGLSDISDKAKEAAGNLLSMTASGIKSGFRSLKSTLSSIKDTISNIGSKASSTASSGFSKILKYGFGIRSLYVLFRRLRTAIKDSFTELQNSGAYYETTKANIEALKSSLTTLKYQFGAAFEPIFNTVAPALQTLINYLVAVMNTISAFIAKLTGKSTYSKAVAATAEIASNTGSAAGSAAELNKQLQGFDERNNLDLDSGSSGGSGGGSSGDSSGVTYVEESVESALGDLTNKIIDQIKAGDWEGVGNTLSTKITEALNGIDWDTIKTKASTFGSNVASFFNGFITTDMFSAVGTTLAEALNTAFTSLNSFGTTFDWTNFGTSIGTGLSTFFKKADFSLWGDTVHTWLAGILDAGITLLETTDFELIGTRLGEFFNSLQVSDLLDKVKTLCSRIITAIGDTITGFKTNADEKTRLATAIGTLLGVLAISKDVKLTLTFTAAMGGIYLGEKYYEWVSGNEVNQSFISELQDIWQGLFEDELISFNIASAIKFVWNDLTGKNNNVDSSGIKAGITTAIGALFGPTSFITGALVTIDVAELISWDFSNFASDFKKNWSLMWNGGTFSDFGKGGNGMPSDVASKVTYSSGFKKELENYGTAIIDGLKEGIELSLKTNPFTAPIVKLYDLIKEAIDTKFEIGSPAKAMYDFGKYIFLGIVQGFIEEMQNYSWADLAEDLYNYWNGEVKTGGTAQGNFNKQTNKTHSGGNKTTATIKTNVETQINGTKTSTDSLSKLKTLFGELTTAASQSTEAEYKAGVGGDLTSIDDLTTWKTKFSNLYKVWLGRDAKFTSSEDGFESKIKGWLQTLGTLGEKWFKSGRDAKFTTSESGLDNFDKDAKNGYLARLSNISTAWEGKGQTRTATFTTNLAGNLDTSDKLNSAASAMSSMNTNFPSGSHSASFSMSLTGSSTADMDAYASSSANLYNNFYTGDHTATYSVSLSSDTSGADSWISKVASKLAEKISNSISGTTSTGKGSASLTKKARGGIITANGASINIPQYATGTLDALKHGTLFAAGENGPEVMGHINGKTEILNRSQIASVMHSAFVSAMSDFRQMELTTPQQLMSDYSHYVANTANGDIGGKGNNTALIEEQNRLLREQNQLLTELLDKPTGITSRDVFNAARSEAQNYYNRTGNSPFVM